MVGRDRFLAETTQVMSAAAEGRPGVVVLDGVAGIGKSTALTELESIARSRGLPVLRGAAAQLDRVVPFTSLRRLLDDRLLDCADHGSSPQDLLDAARTALSRAASGGPLIVILDDAHWVDEVSAWALRGLVPGPPGRPVLWIIAKRPRQAQDCARELHDWLIDYGAAHHLLGPLDGSEVAGMCRNILGAEPDATLAALVRRCGGVPLLVKELLTTLLRSGRVTAEDGVARLQGTGLTVGFRSAVERRFAGLSAEARTLLDAGAVLCRPFTLHEVAALLGRPAMSLLAAVAEAIDASVLVEAGTELAFQHDLIRETVYDQLAPAVRVALHREAASVVRDEGRSRAEAAEHVLRGGRPDDQEVLDVLRGAVAEVAPTAPNTAADLILRTLDLIGPEHPARADLLAEVVRLLAQAGRVVEAREIGESALQGGLTERAESAMRLALAVTLYLAGRVSASADFSRRALQGRRPEEAVTADLLAISAYATLDEDRPAPADLLAIEAAELGDRLGQDGVLVCSATVRGVAARLAGRLHDAARHGRHAVSLADRAGGETRHRHPRIWLTPSLTALDRFAEADAVCSIGQREADRLGTAWSQPVWRYYAAELRLAAGRITEAREEAERGLRVADELAVNSHRVSLHALVAEVAVLRGDLATARVQLDMADGAVRSGLGGPPEDPAWARSRFLLASGEPGASFDALGSVYRCLPDRALVLTRDPGHAAELVRLAMETGEPRSAESVVRAIRALAAATTGVPSVVAAAQHAEGLLHGDPSALRTAVRLYRLSPRPLGLAAALRDVAACERDGGDIAKAVRHFDEARELFASCGAVRDAAVAEKSLRAAAARRRLGSGPECAEPRLTPAEIKVGRLVAEGLTNREVAKRLYLSPHTVDSHLRHSFTKLGVTSRVELTRYVLSHDLDQDADEQAVV